MPFDSETLRIEKERKFLGVWRIRLADLYFLPHEVQRDHTLDPKNVARLVSAFKLNGCDRDTEANFVPALTDKDTLETIMRAEGVAISSLSDSNGDTLLKGHKFAVLHGKHRLEAARQFFRYHTEEEKWWRIQLFSDELSEVARWQLCAQDSNSIPWSDGELFRFHRHYTKIGRSNEANYWLSLIRSPRMLRDIRILESKLHYRPLLDSFDKLIPLRGLWADFKLGCLRRIFDLRTPEALVSYLGKVYDTWATILHKDLFELLDVRSVRVLQALLPYHSRDRGRISLLIHDEKLFPEITDYRRSEVIEKLMKYQDMILSLQTFLEDTKWLEPAIKVIQCYLPQRFGPSVQTALSDLHDEQKRPIEFDWGRDVDEDKFDPWPVSYVAFLQVIAYTWRNFLCLSKFRPRDYKAHYKFASPLHNHEELLQYLREKGFNVEPNIPQVQLFQSQSLTNGDVNIIWDELDLSPKTRNGRPVIDVFAASRDKLFLPNVYHLPTEQVLRFEVTRCIFQYFFPLFKIRREPKIIEETGSKRKQAAEIDSLPTKRLHSEPSESREPPSSATESISIYSRSPDDTRPTTSRLSKSDYSDILSALISWRETGTVEKPILLRDKTVNFIDADGLRAIKLEEIPIYVYRRGKLLARAGDEFEGIDLFVAGHLSASDYLNNDVRARIDGLIQELKSKQELVIGPEILHEL